MRCTPVILLLAVAGSLTGCLSLPRIPNPFHYFSNPAAKAEKFEEKAAGKAAAAGAEVEAAEATALSLAQSSVLEAQVALDAADLSRPVVVARQSIDDALAQLDQVLGPLPRESQERIRSLITALMSEQADVRKRAEQDWDVYRRQQVESAGELREARQNRDRLLESLDRQRAEHASAVKKGFEREHEMANELRRLQGRNWLLLLTTIGVSVFLILGGVPIATLAIRFAGRARALVRGIGTALHDLERVCI